MASGIWTLSASSWGTGKASLPALRSPILCNQEYRVAPAEKVTEISASLTAIAWQSYWAPAITTPKGGSSAGACVVRRDYVDARYASPRDGVIVDGRLVAVKRRLRPCGEVVVYSA